MLLAGTLLTGVGFLLKRVLTGAAAQERVTRYVGLADIAAKMKAQGLSPADVAAVEAFVWGKRREAEIALQQSTPAAADEPSNEPEGYWSQAAMNERAGAGYQTASAQLQEVLLELAHYVGEELWRTQEAWEEFRDRQMALARAEFEGGTIAPLLAASEGESLTRERIAWAQAALEERKRR